MGASPTDLPFEKLRVLAADQANTGHYVLGILIDPQKRKTIPAWGTTLASVGIVRAGDLYITPNGSESPVSVGNHVLTEVRPDDTGNNAVWIFEQLPGPWLPVNRYDPDLGWVQGRRRAVAYTGQPATLTPTGKTTYEARNGSPYVSWEIEELWSNGSGDDEQNAVYPIKVQDVWDDVRGDVEITTQLVPATGDEEASVTIADGVVTQIEYLPYNQYLLQKKVTVWTIANAPTQVRDIFDEDRGEVRSTSQLLASTGTEAGDVAIATGIVTETSYEPFVKGVRRRTRAVWTVANAPLKVTDTYDQDRGSVKSTSWLVPSTGDEASEFLFEDGQVTETTYTPFNAVVVRKRSDVWLIENTPTQIAESFDRERGTTRINLQVMASADLVGTESYDVDSDTVTETSFEPFAGSGVVRRRVAQWVLGSAPAPSADVHDVERGSVHTITQLVLDSGQAGTNSLVSDESTQVSYEPFNSVVRRKRTETWTVSTAPVVRGHVHDPERGSVEVTTHLIARTGSESGRAENNAGTIVETSYEHVTADVVREKIESWVLADAPTQTTDMVDGERGPVDTTTQLVAKTGDELGAVEINVGVVTQYTFEPFNEVVVRARTDTWVLALAPTQVTDQWDDVRGDTQVTAQLVARGGSEVATFTKSGNLVTETNYEPFNVLILRRKVTVYDITHAPTKESVVFDIERGQVFVSDKLILKDGTETAGILVEDDIVTETSYQPFNKLVMVWHTEGWSLSGAPALNTDSYDPERGAVRATTQLVAFSDDNVSSLIINGLGYAFQTSFEPVNSAISRQKLEYWKVSDAPVQYQKILDPERGPVSIQTKLIAGDGSEVASEEVDDGGAQKIQYAPYVGPVIRRTIENWDLANALVVVSHVYDTQRGDVTVTTQLVEFSGDEAATITNDSGVIEQIGFETYSPAIQRKKTEVWLLANAPVVFEEDFDEERADVLRTVQLTALTGSEVASLTVLDGLVTQVTYKPFNELITQLVTEVWDLTHALVQTSNDWDNERGSVKTVRQLQAATGSEVASMVLVETVIEQTTFAPYLGVVIRRSVETWDVQNAPVVVEDGYDPERGALQITSQIIIATGTEAASLSEASDYVTENTYQPYNGPLIRQRQEIWKIGDAPLQHQKTYDERFGAQAITSQLVKKTGSEAASISRVSNTVTVTDYQPVNAVVVRKITTVADVPGPVRRGQDFDEINGIAVPVTFQVRGAAETLATGDKEPIDQERSDFKSLDLTAAQAALLPLLWQTPGWTEVNLPDQLISCVVVWSGDSSNGEAFSSTGQYTSAPGGWFGPVVSTDAQAGASLAGALSARVRRGYNGPVPAKFYTFFLLNTGVTAAAILSKVGASEWPHIRTETEQVVVTGGSQSVKNGLKTQTSVAINLGSPITSQQNLGYERSRRGGVDIRTFDLPACLHGAITVGNVGNPAAGADAVVSSGGAGGSSAHAGVAGTVYPQTLEATSPSSFPTGRFLYRSEVTPYAYGLVRVTAVVVEITNEYT